MSPDTRFFTQHAALSVREICDDLGADLRAGRDDTLVASVSPVAGADDPATLIFIERRETLAALHGRQFGLLLTSPALVDEALPLARGAIAVHEAPKAAFGRIARRLYSARDETSLADAANRSWAGNRAMIAQSADIAADAQIGAGVIIGYGVRVGPRTRLEHGCVITHAQIGADCVIGANTVIGGAGFGFAVDGNGLSRVPQLGGVIIGDRVEIGANTAIDRGALDNTSIDDDTKIDNLVQIAHNVRVGCACIIAAQVGIAGSTVIADGVMIGGQAGIADHLTIGKGARVAARAGLMRDIPPGETWGGYPAKPIRQWLRENALVEKLHGKQKRNT